MARHCMGFNFETSTPRETAGKLQKVMEWVQMRDKSLQDLSAQQQHSMGHMLDRTADVEAKISSLERFCDELQKKISLLDNRLVLAESSVTQFKSHEKSQDQKPSEHRLKNMPNLHDMEIQIQACQELCTELLPVRSQIEKISKIDSMEATVNNIIDLFSDKERQLCTPMSELRKLGRLEPMMCVCTNEIVLERDSNGLGVETSLVTDSLRIEHIRPGGAIDMWNQAHPNIAVQQGDDIVAVNHISGSAQVLKDQLASPFAQQLTLSILRS